MRDEGQLGPEDEALPVTHSEQLTAQFYEWERRGRGWQLWTEPVELEPPFRPFLFHSAPPVGPVFDDARKPTWLGSIIEKVRDGITGSKPPPLPEQETSEPEPEVFDDDAALVELRVSVPPAQKVGKDVAEQLLLGFSSCTRPLSFEIISLPESINIQLTCSEDDRVRVREQLRGHFPDAVVTEDVSLLRECWDVSGTKETVVVDFGLSREFMLPLRTFKNFDPDPLIGFLGTVTELQEGEVGVVQVLFQLARSPWAESTLRAVTDGEGHSFFADAPVMVSLTEEKVSRPLFAVVLRVAAQSPGDGRAWEIARALGGALQQYASPTSNELIPLENDGYEDADHEEDLLLRRTHRSGMLLNIEELVSLVHLPSTSVHAAKLTRELKKTKSAPRIATGHQLVLGENRHGGATTLATLSPEQRSRHTYVIGASGTGKSTLLLNLIVQDIRNGEGVGVLDPHGDLIDHVLGYVPEERLEDVVLLDPADDDYPIGFNILSAHSELERTLLSSDLVDVFRRLSTSWGDQMTSVLGNAILALLESNDGGTLLDLRRFLVEPEFRQMFLKSVRDREVVYYWQREFPVLAGKPQAPLLTRLDTFLRPKLVRHMVAQRENRLDLAAMMNERKIFLAKLAQGAIGEENAYLLGTFLVSKFHQLAMSRQELDQGARRPFYLYIDEFHHFATPSMAAVLAGARKYGLGLILAHQDLRQLGDSEVTSAVLTNPCTRVCFRVGDMDAKRLADGFAFFDARDLQTLGVGEAICRVERADYDFNLRTLPLPVMEPGPASARREHIIAGSRARYGRARAEVEMIEPVPQESDTVVAVSESVTPARTRGPRRARPVAPAEPAVSLPGRGGPQHKYLQSLVRRWAEERGFQVSIEKTVLGGHGHIDVVLERAGCSVACEISVTTRVAHEVQNLTKCLAADFDYAVLLCSDDRALETARGLLADADQERLRFLVPDGLIAFLDTLPGAPEAKIAEVPAGQTDSDESPPPEAKKRLLIAKDAASYIGLAPQTLAKMRVTGDSPPFYKVGRQVLYDRADLDAWLAERRRRSTSDAGQKGA